MAVPDECKIYLTDPEEIEAAMKLGFEVCFGSGNKIGWCNSLCGGPWTVGVPVMFCGFTARKFIDINERFYAVRFVELGSAAEVSEALSNGYYVEHFWQLDERDDDYMPRAVNYCSKDEASDRWRFRYSGESNLKRFDLACGKFYKTLRKDEARACLSEVLNERR